MRYYAEGAEGAELSEEFEVIVGMNQGSAWERMEKSQSGFHDVRGV